MFGILYPGILLFDEVCVLVVGSYPFFCFFFLNFVFNFQGFGGVYIFLLRDPCRSFIIIRQVLRRSCKYRDICVDILMHASIVLLLHIDADLDIYIFEISKLLARQVAPFADQL